MVTRIKSVNVGKLGRVSGRRPSKAKGSTTANISSSRNDDVAFSSDGRIIGKADEVIHNAPGIRMELVGPIREALAGGRYHVSSLDVADKILRQVLMERKKTV